MDLRMAYDSVPRKALWCVLEGYGVPPMLSVIRSFQKDMTAVVRVGDNLTRLRWLRHAAGMAGCPRNSYLESLRDHDPGMVLREDEGTWWRQMSWLLGWDKTGLKWHSTARSGKRLAESAVTTRM